MSLNIKNKPLCIMQARMGSSRFPGKVLQLVKKDVPLLEYEVLRVRQAKRLGKIVVATTEDSRDDAIENLCRKLKVDIFRGSCDDVLDRYFQCAKKYATYDTFVRLTADCPLIDPAVIDEVIALFESGSYDYAGNSAPATFPEGMDVEVFSRAALEEAWKKARLASEREHVTSYIWKHGKKFRNANLTAAADFSFMRLTVDRPEDIDVIKFVIQHSSLDAGYLHYISLFTKHSDVFLKNMHITRREGYIKSLKEDTVWPKKQ
jgi:spore coat polysaccharide biosynthesis protein SpsF (cytidylyltransferase family)